jgi:hypothetical protein
MTYEQEMLLYWILVLVVVAFIGGWVAKVALDQHRADKRRKEEALQRRLEYEMNLAEEYAERIKEVNREKLFYELVKRGAKE